MIDLTFQIKKNADGVVVLEFGIAFRILFAALALILGFGIASSGSVTPLPAGFFAILLLGSLYLERWEFDPTSGTVTSRHGLVFLNRRKRWNFTDVESVEYTHYRVGSVPGSPQTPPDDETTGAAAANEAMNRFGRLGRGLERRFLRYGLRLNDGRYVRIELRRVRDWNRDQAIPTTIATTIGVPTEITPV